jgi:hypothetical protein
MLWNLHSGGRDCLPRAGVAAMSSKPKLRVLVADDYAPMREQIRLALENSCFMVCAEAGYAPAAIEAAA